MLYCSVPDFNEIVISPAICWSECEMDEEDVDSLPRRFYQGVADDRTIGLDPERSDRLGMSQWRTPLHIAAGPPTSTLEGPAG